MRLLAAIGVVLLLGCDAKPAGGAVVPKGGGAPAQDAAGWRTYHGNFALDGIAGSQPPDAPERLWKFKAGNRVDVTPVAADGRIHFTTAKGGLVAVDPAGNELWRISIAPDTFGSPPALMDGLVVVCTGKGLLKAYQAADGKEKWSYDVGGSAGGSPNRVDLPGGRKGVVLISQSEGALQCVELETGKGVWKMPGVERCDGSAGVSGGRIVMGSCASALHVYSIEKAEKSTDVPLGGDNQVAGGVAMSGTSAFAGTRSGKLCAVDVAAGKILWTNADGQGEAFMTPAVNEKVVVFGADDGKVYCLRRDTGAKIWAMDTGNRPMSPVIAGDRVVVSSGGALFLYDLATGKQLWTAKVSDDISAPAVVGGMILVGCDDGTVTAYGRK